MKIYISGKITGLDYAEAFASFERAESDIAFLGHTPVNPMKSVGEVEGKEWIEYMVEDLAILNDCDAIYLMSNWQDSNGAKLEKAFCEILGMPVFYQESVIGTNLAFAA